MINFRIIIILFLLGSILGCTQDYPMNICDVRILPVSKDSTIYNSRVNGYYYSNFVKEQLNFEMYFIENDTSEWADIYRNTYYWINSPVDSSIELFFNKEIEVNDSLIEPKLNIIQFFEIQKYEDLDKRELIYLLTVNNQNQIILKDTFYTINVKLKTSDYQELKDSCIIKYFKK